MSFLVDSSVFLHLLLDEERADEAERFLSTVEVGAVRAYVTTHVLEEVSFKLLLAKGSELGESSFWGIKRRFLRDEKFRSECLRVLDPFRDYISSLRGLIVESVTLGDWERSMEICKHGLLTSDALLAAVALRLRVPIYTFDLDFRKVPGLEVKP